MSSRLVPSVRIRVCAAVLAVGLAAACAQREQEAPPPADTGVSTLTPDTLTLCLYPGFAPFVSQNPDGSWTGWDYDFLVGFKESLGLENLHVHPVSTFDGIWLQPGAGLCDVAAAGISDLAERRRATCPGGVWSDHYYHVVRAFAVRTEDAGKVNGIADLAGKKVIVTGGSTADLDLVDQLEKAGLSAMIVRTDDERGSAQQVRDGRGPDAPYAYGGGYGSIEWLKQDLGGLVLAWPHCYMQSGPGFAQVEEPFSFVVRAASTGLAAALDAYIANPTRPYEGELPPGPPCPAAPAPPKCPPAG